MVVTDRCLPMVRAPGGSIYRCSKNRDHTRASRTYSFFEKSILLIQDIMLFIKNYLEKCSLSQCARFSGMSYGSTSVNWASFIREIFKEYFYRNLRFKKLHGIIEIEESLFGRRVKFHRGNPNRGLKIWIFGMVEHDSNTLIIYPVCDRTEETLLPIIERHVEKGSTIYSDGWSAYCKLNESGYEHFTVIHKYSFKKTYVNTKTHDIVEVHTNRIEGAWKHAKDHFRKLSGTKITQFEGHLAEIMWRSAEKGNVYQAFVDFFRSFYTLTGPAEYSYSTPLFNTWDGVPLPAANSQFDEWKIRPENTDAESDASSQSDGSLELFSSIPTSRITMENRELSSTELRERQTHEKSSLDKVFDEMIGPCSDEGDKPLTETASPAPNIDDEWPVNVPGTNQYVRRSGRRKKSLSTGKWNAIVISSDDDSKPPSCTAEKVSTASIASRLRPPKASHESGQYGA
nr:uncharacterized protein LOC105339761 [Crassostrea gigas]